MDREMRAHAGCALVIGATLMLAWTLFELMRILPGRIWAMIGLALFLLVIGIMIGLCSIEN